MSRLWFVHLWNRVALFIWITVAVFVAAVIGIALTRETGRIASIWLANAVVLLAVLKTSPKRWAGWLVCGLAGNLAANLVMGDAGWMAIILGLCNSVEILLAGWLFRIWEPGEQADLTYLKSLIKFLFIAGVLAPTTSAALAALALHLHQGLPFLAVFRTWFAADALGLLIIVPVFAGMAWPEFTGLLQSARRWEALIILLIIPVATVSCIQGGYISWIFILSPLLLLAAFRFGFLGAALAIFLAAACGLISISFVTSHVGDAFDLRSEILFLQVFLFANVLMCLPIANLVSALRDSEALLTAITEAIPDPIFLKGREGHYLFSNSAMYLDVGKTPDQVLGKTDAEIYDDPVASALMAIDQRIMEKNKGEVVEEVVPGPKGYRIYQSSKAPYRDAEGRVIGVIGSARDITERKRGEDALRDNEKKYRALIETTGTGYLILDDKGKVLDANQEYLRFTGRSELSEILGRSVLEWTADYETQKNAEAVVRCLKVGFIRNLEIDYVDGSGRITPLEINATLDGEGDSLRIISLCRDITERKQVEKDLLESEERWKFAIEGSGDGLWDWNVETGMAYFSPRYKEMLGYSDTEIGTGSDEWSKRIHPDDASEVFATLQPYMEGRPGHATIEFRMLCKDGSWRWVQGRGMVVSRDPDGKPIRMIGTNTDITEQRKTKDDLVAQSTALSAVIDNNPMSIQILDSEGRTTRTNPAFLKLFGSIPPAGYCMFSDPTLASQGLGPLFDRIQAGEVVFFPETSYNAHDLFPELPDSPVWVRAIGFPINGASGRPERFVLMHEDVSHRRNAEQARAELQAQLQQSQKMESLGTLAGGVAHDMNNVLGAILGLASAHIGTQPYGSPLHQALGTIFKATERGGKTVRSLLNFARQSPVENRRLDMNAILKEEVALLERTTLAKVRLVIALEANLRPILGDASALTHAFMNLCVNAVDAMPENGTLTLHTRNVDNDWIEVVVEDNGTGMSKEVLEKAMEPFYTTKETGQGTGLGLSMVFSTVKAHQGQMSIESEQGKGTRVMMRFPACEEEAPVLDAAPEASEALQAPPGAIRVLLVDDDDLIQSSVQMILEVLGHTTVKTALSGEEALAMLEGGLEADLVILDMNMPGLGGIGTLPRLRMLRPALPVLLATGRVDQTAQDLVSAHPGVTLLSKPFGLRELQKHLERIGVR
jgi:PAS domain S-box-containing protein